MQLLLAIRERLLYQEHMLVGWEVSRVLVSDPAVTHSASRIVWLQALPWPAFLNLFRRLARSVVWSLGWYLFLRRNSCLNLVLLLRLFWHWRLGLQFFRAFVCKHLIALDFVVALLFRIFVFGLQVEDSLRFLRRFLVLLDLFFKIGSIVVLELFLVISYRLFLFFWDFSCVYCRRFFRRSIWRYFSRLSCWRLNFFNGLIEFFFLFGFLCSHFG